MERFESEGIRSLQMKYHQYPHSAGVPMFAREDLVKGDWLALGYDESRPSRGGGERHYGMTLKPDGTLVEWPIGNPSERRHGRWSLVGDPVGTLMAVWLEHGCMLVSHEGYQRRAMRCKEPFQSQAEHFVRSHKTSANDMAVAEDFAYYAREYIDTDFAKPGARFKFVHIVEKPPDWADKWSGPSALL